MLATISNVGFRFMINSNSDAPECSIRDLHKEARLELNIKVSSDCRRTLGKEGMQNSLLNLRD